MPPLRAIAKTFLRPIALTIDLPTWPDDLAKRDHNKFIKDALRKVILKHFGLRIPEHFRRSAHAKYGYADRRKGYILSKKREHGHDEDLVRTGASMRQMTTGGPRITIGGAAVGGKAINGTLHLKFSWSGKFAESNAKRFSPGYRRKRAAPQIKAGVTPEQMKSEVRRMRDEERAEMSKQLSAEYWSLVNEKRRTRKRVRIHR